MNTVLLCISLFPLPSPLRLRTISPPLQRGLPQSVPTDPVFLSEHFFSHEPPRGFRNSWPSTESKFPFVASSSRLTSSSLSLANCSILLPSFLANMTLSLCRTLLELISFFIESQFPTNKQLELLN